ncbi:hypothetical protein TRVL_09769 [Trypanosoma vivax]|nr:hypothetical protein TRVL_09769 [Trypanosoma vivax]
MRAFPFAAASSLSPLATCSSRVPAHGCYLQIRVCLGAPAALSLLAPCVSPLAQLITSIQSSSPNFLGKVSLLLPLEPTPHRGSRCQLTVSVKCYLLRLLYTPLVNGPVARSACSSKRYRQ